MRNRGETGLQAVLLIEPRSETGRFQVLEAGKTGETAAELESSLDGRAFEDGVREIRKAIADGRVYQVNLSRRFAVTGWQAGLQPLYAAAIGGPVIPEYAGAFRWGGADAGELVCASMECLVRRHGRHLETRPIKGTRPRGATPEADCRLIRDLEVDPKEGAELAMIVDLERNDLGRVSETGSVRVEDPGSVHTWDMVHHRVARVSSRLAEGAHWLDVLAAVVPGGSVTGCPKRAAMAMIADLEPVRRGPFTGALGVVAGDGDLDLSIPIRTAWSSPNGFEMAAGCGIVWESHPELEEAESRVKVQRWLGLLNR